ncbi:MAG TPA: iron-containing alcohol dehydrogenase [Oscillospiraceae bacterium]|nr:iron-containing alcohol dehydrogenase [Oscillospiraceae bacterium]HPF56047.1 iron-containing alcohol dehydrogenase [Clostridiales bacterium]HPK36375.1 iron-containing alcohol dehydrogenase [Oscillospiraceae bacterium]HPR75751.1 iron-containing alcohol dehydrogenase [Oscillospiraceae bacterium]
MDLQALLKDMKNCPCGKTHTFNTQFCEIGSGLTAKTGEILEKANFDKKILLVADRNTLAAADGILDALKNSGFIIKQFIYNDQKYANAEQVDEVEALCADIGSIISVGTGSLNDICRVAAFRKNKQYCIFATAPSMDGFASDTAPIVKDNYKTSWQAKQPEVIIGDTKILAASPTILKSAGFGDVMAKYLALVEWKIGNIVAGEYYCDNVAGLVREALRRITALCDHVTDNDEQTAGKIMEVLVLTGLAMKLTGNSRPAAGSEHVVSHFWECKKIVKGIWPDFHGRKVGVATVLINRMFRQIAADYPEIETHADNPDWEAIKKAYGPALVDSMLAENNPSIIDGIEPAHLKACWPEIRNLVLTELPTDEHLVDMMKRAGAAITPEEVHVDAQLLHDALKYHPYMRRRLLLSRLLPMTNVDIDQYIK